MQQKSVAMAVMRNSGFQYTVMDSSQLQFTLRSVDTIYVSIYCLPIDAFFIFAGMGWAIENMFHTQEQNP